MLRHFVKIFLRTTLKDRTYSIINVSGLAVGLACAIFIFLWIKDELSYDRFNEHNETIYQVLGNHSFPDGIKTFGNTPGPLAKALKEFPEIKESCRTNDQARMLFTAMGKSIYESGIYADETIFDVFTIPLIETSAVTTLPDNNSIAISKKLALKYFGTENVIGKVFRIDNNIDVKVTAVFENMPTNSTLQFEFILPYELYAKADQYNSEWGAWTGGATYILTNEVIDINGLAEKINKTITQPKIWPRWDDNVSLIVSPMLDWRLHDFVDGKKQGGRINYVKAFSIVGVFILLMACINFMNLATARSVSRSKEVGVRKVVGADKQSLITQFFGESILFSIISLSMGLLIVHLLLPSFNDLTGKQLMVDYRDPILYDGLAFITLFTGLISGSYPAFFLSSIKAINALKGKLTGSRGTTIRQALVISQFSISIILIIGAVVAFKQIEYMRSKNLGFDRNNLFFIRSNESVRKNFDAFKKEVTESPSVISVARSTANPMSIEDGMVLDDNAWPGKTKEDDVLFKMLQVDYDLIPALGFKLIAGRNFSNEFISDSTNYIVSEEAVRVMRLQGDPIGQELKAPKPGHIIGIIEDFHSTGLQSPVLPVIIAMNTDITRRVFVRYDPGKLEEAMNIVRTTYAKYAPEFPMEYTFMDETFRTQYENEILIGKFSRYFTGIAIFISCLGLFGLSSFTAERRSKEISIRKTLGASVLQMVVLLCKDFMIVMVWALVISIPVAWWASSRFLETFQFRMEITSSIFVITAISMLMIALITISYQSIQAARANPATILKSE